jgi:hypothetical protein
LKKISASVGFIIKKYRNILLKHEVFLTHNLLTTTIVAPPSNASKWQIGINSAFKGLKTPLMSAGIIKFIIFSVSK